MDHRQFAAGFIMRPFDELPVFINRDRHFGGEQRAPVTVFDAQADIVPDALLVEALEVLRIGGNNDVRHALHVFARPRAGFVFLIANH